MGHEEPRKETAQAAKLSVIRSFFGEWEQRTAFLKMLFNNDHKSEALLLCCCYIEGFGNGLYGEDRPQYNFVRVLKEHGGDKTLSRIHPEELRIGLARANSKMVRKIGAKLDNVLPKAQKKLYTENEILRFVKRYLTDNEKETLRQHLWRGSLAAFAYRRIRSEQVHTLIGPVQFMSPSDNTPFPEFLELYQALTRILQAVKEVSLISGKWFGHYNICHRFAERS